MGGDLSLKGDLDLEELSLNREGLFLEILRLGSPGERGGGFTFESLLAELRLSERSFIKSLSLAFFRESLGPVVFPEPLAELGTSFPDAALDELTDPRFLEELEAGAGDLTPGFEGL